jgi:hypothetical protein
MIKTEDATKAPVPSWNGYTIGIVIAIYIGC